MRTTGPRAPARHFLLFALFFLAVHASASFALAQGGPISRPPGSGRDLSDSERDRLARESETNRRNESAPRDPSAVMAEVNEDFARLRELNEGLNNAASSAAPPDHRSIAASAEEVRKRATRLKTNLSGLPAMAKGDKLPKVSPPADDAQLKTSTAALAETLKGFLTNPVFSDAGTLDPQLAVKARRDLETLLLQSEALRKGAGKLAGN